MVAFPVRESQKHLNLSFFAGGKPITPSFRPQGQAASRCCAVLRIPSGRDTFRPSKKEKRSRGFGKTASEGECVMKKDIKEELVKLITEKIATDKRLPWDKGLLNGEFFPINFKTGKRYRGINLLLLMFLGGGTQEYIVQ